MKKLLILTLLFVFCLPVFSYEKKYTPDGFVDNTEYVKYYNKLRQEWLKKVNNGEISCSDSTFTQYVRIPLQEFKEELFKDNH